MENGFIEMDKDYFFDCFNDNVDYYEVELSENEIRRWIDESGEDFLYDIINSILLFYDVELVEEKRLMLWIGNYYISNFDFYESMDGFVFDTPEREDLILNIYEKSYPYDETKV